MAAAVAAAAARTASGGGHYAALGVPSSADAAAIRRAYRSAALALHPDKNCAPGAADQFRRAVEAWEVLGDARKRRAHDFGEALFGSDEDGADGGAAAAWDQEAFDAAPLKVKALAVCVLVAVLTIRAFFWALGGVVGAVAFVLRWVLAAVIVVGAVAFVAVDYLLYGVCYLALTAARAPRAAFAALLRAMHAASARRSAPPHPPPPPPPPPPPHCRTTHWRAGAY
jgi:curved DNA-binding protein CbpA